MSSKSDPVRNVPWEENWEKVQGLGCGGQGTTLLVRSKSHPHTEGVLKTLKRKKANDPKARRRMHQEVTNLGIVADAGGNVPKILDGNTENYSDCEILLYFVMEYVPGQTLSQFLKDRGKLPPDDAIRLALALCDTTKCGHEARVMHRDLKPGNILVRDFEKGDFVIVDYGLSFNEQVLSDSELTDVDERIGNDFSDLPERRTPGAQRRCESDCTAICGVLYYCLTGFYPVPFADALQNKPHRRPGKTIREAWPEYPCLDLLEAVLDRAYEPNINDRFATVAELTARLEAVSRREGHQRIDDIAAYWTAAEKRLVKRSRPALLQHFAQIARPLLAEIEVHLRRHPTQGKFQMRTYPYQAFGIAQNISSLEIPKGIDDLNAGTLIVVSAAGFNAQRGILYIVGSEAKQCVLLRYRLRAKTLAPEERGAFVGGGFFSGGMQTLMPMTVVVPACKVVWYQGDEKPTPKRLLEDLDDSIVWAVDELIGELGDPSPA